MNCSGLKKISKTEFLMHISVKKPTQDQNEFIR